MKKFFKALRLLGVTAAILIAVLAVFLFVFSRDIAPTDVSELIPPELPEVAAEDNAFTYFMQAEALILKPYEPEVLTQFISGNQCDTNELIKVLAANEPMLAEIKEGLLKKVCLIPEISRRVCSFPHISEWMHIRMVLLARSKYQLVFRYNQAKEIVYSVGRNLKDEGGSIEQGYRGNKLQASARFKGEDYIFGIKKKQFFLPLRH